jgi:hypothetical protein
MGGSPAEMNWKTFSLTLTNEREECLGQLSAEWEITSVNDCARMMRAQ